MYDNILPRRTFVRQLICLSICLVSSFSWQVSAAWYEAQGQALILNDNRDLARQQATEEAIKQALLFAGASVTSVQTLTNGLLKNDALRVTANGEVSNVELIDERWHNDYVTVRIRADIFPQVATCETSSFKKTIASTYFAIQNPHQVQDGQVRKFPEALARELKRQFAESTDNIAINYIAPYAAQWSDPAVLRQAPALARQSKSQFILAGVITDLSVVRAQNSSLMFWDKEEPTRQFGISVTLIDGVNGATLLESQYSITAPWQYDRFSHIDVAGHGFWQSAYGSAVSAKLSELIHDVSDTLTCHPATGRVLQIQNQQIQVSIGREHGIEVGDELFLYQTNQVQDAFGQSFLQYRLYPAKVKVTAAYADTATVEAVDGAFLANIQPNDFVAKR